jgi:hypothetical protein
LANQYRFQNHHLVLHIPNLVNVQDRFVCFLSLPPSSYHHLQNSKLHPNMLYSQYYLHKPQKKNSIKNGYQHITVFFNFSFPLPPQLFWKRFGSLLCNCLHLYNDIKFQFVFFHFVFHEKFFLNVNWWPKLSLTLQ